jgi:dinuclear metal center YbgI/SA1388 family protein
VDRADAAPRLGEVITAFEGLYDPAWAMDFDAVGLVCGETDRVVRRILFAVDPLAPVVDEALERRADLVIAHHPLLLRGVHSVAAATPKGRTVHRLIAGGVALYTAHTNADTANPGVSDALAAAVGLTGALRPLSPDPGDPEGRRGIGRVGALAEAMPLADFAARVAEGLPATPAGIRVAGDPARPVRTVAVSGGAGDSLLEAARASGADVYVTSDLRHHPASEFIEAPGPALIDTPHWASEWPWLGDAAARLRHALAERGATVETHVSTIVTDAWTRALGGVGSPAPSPRS